MARRRKARTHDGRNRRSLGLAISMCNLYSVTKEPSRDRRADPRAARPYGKHAPIPAFFPIPTRRSCATHPIAFANCCWRDGASPALRNLAARRLPTFATPRARIGGMAQARERQARHQGASHRRRASALGSSRRMQTPSQRYPSEGYAGEWWMTADATPLRCSARSRTAH